MATIKQAIDYNAGKGPTLTKAQVQASTKKVTPVATPAKTVAPTAPAPPPPPEPYTPD